MRAVYELPKMSLVERDRRWAAVRSAMKDRGLDCLVVCGWPTAWDFNVANARYLCPIGGNSSANLLVFPQAEDPTCFIFTTTSLKYWLAGQDWVTDVRPRTGTWSASIVERLKSLGLSKGNIGFDGLGSPLDSDGWLPHQMYSHIQESLPGATLTNIKDLLEQIRTIKSTEEIETLETAAHLGNLMLEACREIARPGVRECAVYAHMREAMVANGGEEPTLFLWASDAQPLPHPFSLPTMRPLERGDLILCEIHPKYAGYCTHVERTYCLGEPEQKYRDIYDGCIAAYEQGLALFGPGKSITTAMETVKENIEGRGLRMYETGIHGHGLGSLEYPRYRHHAIQSDRAAIAALGDDFRPGMVFAFNIDLVDPKWHDGETGCVFAETIHITETGARRMHDYPMDFQILSA